MQQEGNGEPALGFGRFRLDAARGALLRDGVPVHLRPKSYEVLAYLVGNPGRLVTRRELMDRVWGPAIVTDDSLTQCLIEIRRALEDKDHQIVRTVPRRGFVFEPPAAPGAGTPPAVTAGNGSSPAPVPTAAAPASPVAAASPPPPRAWSLPVIAGCAALLCVVAWWILVRPAGVVDGTPAAVTGIAPGHSIAVLRFADLTAGGDEQYLADGLAEEVLHRLAQSPDLVVIARSSSFAIEPGKADVREVGRRLGVGHVLEGSVRRDDDTLRVTAQLIDARTGAHVWSRRFDREATDLLALQDDIARSVAESLHTTLATAASGMAGVDPAAEELFLQGLFLYNRRGPGDVDRACDYFERAIAIQPDHARALTALAGALRLQAFSGAMDWDESFATQQALLTRALVADPGLAEAHARLFSVQSALGRDDEARNAFERALELDPRSPLVLGLRAGRAFSAGRFDEAAELAAQVVRLDPLSAVSQGNHGHMLFAAGRLEEAEEAWRHAADLSPGSSILPDIARIRILQGRFGDAVELARKAPQGPLRDQVLATAAPVAGTQAEADAALARLRSAATRTSHALLAEVFAFQGRSDEAFGSLQRAVAGSSGQPRRIDLRKEPATDWQRATEIIRASPFLAPLRNDPRWAGYADLSR